MSDQFSESKVLSAFLESINQQAYRATHDALTGLDSRASLYHHMNDRVQAARKNRASFAVLFIDVDRFKLINDSLGHGVGDELLKAMAERLQKLTASQDVLARIGGDKFVLMITLRENENERMLIHRLIALFDEPYDVVERKISLTVSVGVSVYPRDGDTVDLLLQNADIAMYRAKIEKGSSYRIYHPNMRNESLSAQSLAIALHQAIANNELFLCYQPQIELNTGNVVAVEALIRWRHPEKGVMLPMDFIPQAEDAGLMVAIGEWVLRSACAQNKSWQEAGFPAMRVAVNVSAQQFRHYNFIEAVKNILQETRLDPQYLELELTESIILTNPEIVRVVTELKELGISITVDDFGTGLSSLSYLHKVPLDRLKIDRSFIQQIATATDDELTVKAILAMAKSLQLKVLAEGVETAAQIDFLRKNACQDVQGFYFSEPLAVREIEKYFQDGVPTSR